MEKKGKKISWCVVEHPTDNVIAKFFFEEDAQRLLTFKTKKRFGKKMVVFLNFFGITVDKLSPRCIINMYRREKCYLQNNNSNSRTGSQEGWCYVEFRRKEIN
jgi:hypothetical protein